ncbi:MAG: PP2C family protein-serine/threonine phosphatase [Phycisphaerae bacterium]|jgi:phosphoserine phosphatase|nr:PP2C family protein-serine/threonine phosphatase [Phycisphaerae bacterium]
MTENESKALADLQKILDITRVMVATVDLGDLLKLIIDRSMELLDAERASVFLYEEETNELVSIVAAGSGEIRFPADQGLAGAAAQSNTTINVSDAYNDDRFDASTDHKSGFRTRNILSVPLRYHQGALVGLLQVLNKRGGDFSDYDVNLAETLGAQAGVALQRAKLIEHYVAKQEMQRAMEIAREIQRALLPDGPPLITGFDVAGFSESADDTGGDTYDFLQLQDGRWLLAVADASGHGVGPALVIAQTRAMLRAIAMQGRDVSTILATSNNLLCRDLQGRFVTCFLSMLDPITAGMTYASAGHGPLLFYDRQADEFDELPATGLPMGVLEETDYNQVVARQFRSGDFAAITTDGFFEAENVDGEMFGMTRLRELLRDGRDLPSAEMIASLRKATEEFTRGMKQADDLTVIIIKKE